MADTIGTNKKSSIIERVSSGQGFIIHYVDIIEDEGVSSKRGSTVELQVDVCYNRQFPQAQAYLDMDLIVTTLLHECGCGSYLWLLLLG